MLISRSSLWTTFDCANPDKTRVYFERSKSSPLTLSISRKKSMSPNDPLLQVIPHATSRLKYLHVLALPDDMGSITTHLSRPAPLLEDLMIDCVYVPGTPKKFVLPPSLFNGNLSSLRTLCVGSICTNLPWRNMVNLTSFDLRYIPLEDFSIGRLLDFFEGAPRLEGVDLTYTTPISGAQRGRLVQLACLARINIQGAEPCSLLLDHLLIPVGAEVSIWADSPSSRFEGHLPRSFHNFGNLSNLMEVSLHFSGFPIIQFTGSNGRLKATCWEPEGNVTSSVLEYLARIDTSTVERLEISSANQLSRDLSHRALLRMKNLRILKLYRCQGLHFFFRALHPDTTPVS